MIGKFLKNSTNVPKKSPNRYNMPTDSSAKPINDRLIRIKRIPPKKKSVALIFVGRAKKYTARAGPIIKTTPITKRKFPIASNAESKKAKMPKKKKKTPAAVEPTPYSASVSRGSEKILFNKRAV